MPKMIYDAFLFFNELDLLKIRLEELKDAVDRFVLVEATLTHSGAAKPLYFERYRDLYSDYADRITHHVVSDTPRFALTSRYVREIHQREAIAAALERAGCKPGDVVLVSDVDEIPSGERLPEALAWLASNDLVVFEQIHFEYYVNRTREHNWLGTVACRYDFLRDLGSVQELRVGRPPARRAGVDLRKKNIETKYPHFPRGGWHLSFLGGPDAVLYKRQSYAHCQRDPTARGGLPYIRFNTGLCKLTGDPKPAADGPGRAPPRNYHVEEELPRHLSENRELFAHFFEPLGAPEEEDPSTELYDAGYHARRRLLGRIELLVERCRRLMWERFPRAAAARRGKGHGSR